jgi:para-nitrobenzyl esterase
MTASNTAQSGMSRRRAMGLAAGAIGGAAILPSAGWSADGPVVETAHGKIRGFINDGVYTFRGVRYGAPTGGPNRFMPPQPPTPWGGVVDATEYGYSAPQTNPATRGAGGPPGPRSEIQELLAASNGYRADPDEREDCLFLNVWTKSIRGGRRRPVVVWLHGGGFSSGSASALLYDGSNMVKRGDVVFVGVNHRLNAFGYTNLSQIGGADYAKSGVAGMLDIVQALAWVRDNIAQFGGDPSRVMIFGESGGGAKVSFLLGCPPAKGLFHRAVVESGPGVRMGEPKTTNAGAEALLAELGLTTKTLSDIHKLPTERILAAYFAAQARVAQGGLGGGAFNPSLQPEVCPAHPFDPVASPVSQDVPVIVGFNRTEATLFQLSDAAAFALDEAGLTQRVQKMFGNRSGDLLAAYRAALPQASPSDVYFVMATDQLMGADSILLAERKAQDQGAPAYLYRFDWRSPALGGKLRSPHGIEMPFVFDNVSEGGFAQTGGTKEAKALAAKICGAWCAFAETGDPNGGRAGLPHWSAYDAASRSTMIFNTESQVVRDPDGAARRLLAEIRATA